ncbi:O-antigen ligase family protein [Natronococcus sp.]|uniref:O-antigen ligase family protein n=1 Tax=Natronococcus sp. TaxID=35747 RepID=UPI003A4E59CA
MIYPWRSLTSAVHFEDVSSRIFRVELLVVLLLYSSVYSHTVFFEPILGPLPNPHYALLALLSLYVLYRLYDGLHLPRATGIASIVFGAFCLYYSVTILWSPASEYALYKATRLLTVTPLLFAATIIIATDQNGKHRVLRIFKYVLGLALLIALVTFYARGFNHSLSQLMGVNYLIYSRVLGVGALTAVLFATVAETQRRRLRFAGLAAVLLVAMFLTGGRGPLIAAVMMATGIVAVRFHQTGRSLGWRSIVTGASISVLGLAVLAVVIGARTIERFTTLLTLQDGSAATRLDLYWVAIESWSNAPLFGHGIGSYSIVGDVGRHPYWPHNLFLEVGAEAGLVGIILLILPFGIALFQFITFETEISPSGLLAIAFVGYMLLNASLTGDISENRALFVALAMLFATDRSPKFECSLAYIGARVRTAKRIRSMDG